MSQLRIAVRLALLCLTVALLGTASAAMAQTLDYLGRFPANAIRGEDGLVYVPDPALDEVRRVHADGFEEVVLGPEGDGAGHPFELDTPYPGLVVAADGSLLVTEAGFVAGSDDVFFVAADGGVVAASDGTPIEGETPAWPRSLRLGRDGSFYFRAGPGIFRVEPDGATSVAFAGALDFTDYAVARDGSIFLIPLVQGVNADYVLELVPGGIERTHVVGDPVGGEIDPLTPFDLELDRRNHLYVATAPGEPGVGVFRVGNLGAVTRLLDASGNGQGNEALEPVIAGIDRRRNVYVQANRSGPLVYNAFQITRGRDVALIAEDGTGVAGLGALRNGRVFYVVILEETGYALADHFEYQPGPECADGLDNDGDGNVDHPNDPRCGSPDASWEGPAVPVCGEGLSMAVLLPVAVAWRVRRQRPTGVRKTAP